MISMNFFNFYLLCVTCRLLMREVKTAMGVLQTASKCGMVSFTHDLYIIRQQSYKLAGQYLTWSFVNGGPGLGAMCPSAFAAMIGKDVRVEDIEHLPDATARANLDSECFNLREELGNLR